MTKNLLPEYLLKWNNMVKFLIFTAMFALLFINIYFPFNSNSWVKYVNDNESSLIFFFYSTAVVALGMLVLTISRRLLCFAKNKMQITYFRYTLWIISEIVFISIMYSFLIYFLVPIDGRSLNDILITALSYTVLVLFIPYLVSYLYLALKEREVIIQNILNNNESLPSTEIAPPLQSNIIINFMDEKGVLKLSVVLDNLVYIESADNYIDVFYLNKGKIGHFIIRNSLKSIENKYPDYSLVRCHRKYIVNFNKVKVLRREKEGLFLEFDMVDVPDIPVSKTYTQSIMKLFSAT